jgi:transcriptional regulator with AAA-type ATPase domain
MTHLQILGPLTNKLYTSIISHLKNKTMENNLQELLNNMNEMVTNGQLVDAAEKYYASNIRTIEFDGRVTEGKQAAMKKLTDFVGSIQKVKEITLLRSVSDNNASFCEYILDIDMNDGSNVYLHEIVRSLWENGQVVEERYFKG